VYQPCSRGGPDGAVHLCAVLGRIRKSAFNISLARIALIVRSPTLLATAGLIRLLLRKSVHVTDKCMPGKHRGRASVLHSDCIGELS